MLEGDWDTCVAMARDQVNEGAHVIDVCVDYTGADGVADMTEVASRLATQSTRAAHGRHHRGAGRARPRSRGSAAAPLLNSRQPRGGRRRRAPASTLPAPGPRVRRRRRRTCIDEEGQARTADWKVRAAQAIHDLAVDRYGLEPQDLFYRPARPPALDGDGGVAPRRHRDDRGDPADQGGAPGRPHDPRTLERLVRPQPRGAPGPQLGLPPRVRRGRPRRGDRPRLEDPPAVADRRAGPRGLPRPHLRPAQRRLRPALRSARPLRGRHRRRRPHPTTTLDWPVERGSSSGSSTATATASRPTSTRRWPKARRPRHRQRPPARRHEDASATSSPRARCSCPSCSSRPRR